MKASKLIEILSQNPDAEVYASVFMDRSPCTWCEEYAPNFSGTELLSIDEIDDGNTDLTRTVFLCREA